MRASVLLLVLSTSTTSITAINFPSSNPSNHARGRLVFNRQTFSTASCAASGETVSTVVLSTGEGRVLQSPNYPSNYPEGQSCTYNLEPALPGTEDHGAHRLAGGGAGGRAERLPVEDQPALGGVGGVGGGEVDGCDGGGGGGED